MKRTAIVMAAWAAIAGCGSSESSVSIENSGQELDQTSEEGTTLAATTLPTTTEPSPSTLSAPTTSNGAPEFVPVDRFSTGPIEHSCGTFSLEQDHREVGLRRFGDDGWEFLDGVGAGFKEPVAIAVSKLADVTGDEQPEIVMSWYPEASNHTLGKVFVATQPECEWKAAIIVDPCGSSEWVPDLWFTDDGTLTQYDFGGCGKVAGDSSRLEWNDEFEVFLYEPLKGSTLCEEYPDYDELPISACRAGWVVEMAQAAIARQGIRVDEDGHFGRSTRLAVLAYQRSNGLELTGEVDTATWAVMYPVGGPDGTNLAEFPDFDGDGISSPSEIGEATELGD